ncbi:MULTISPECIES: SGNH/GDSL hydrolase family protein [unclassified Nocardioides]|uniref:SGNH/GDSL hydrolase family protein n=1 Tax=unclassified Nocardioides TaxID=2615069 RepID=UPI001885AE4D|nr:MULTISPECIES: SGNH/GDSL hydrolase family protein [unclassified Nocardioides]
MSQGRSRRRRRLAAVLAALVVGATGTVWVAGQAIGGDAGRCERFTAAATDRAGTVTGTGRSVLVVGDSYAAGLLLEDPLAAWPTRLDGRLRVAGFSGSGFSRAASGCGDVSFATRAADALRAHPDAEVVVVEGGLNDHDQRHAEIVAGFTRLTQAVGARPLVVVGPPLAPARTEQARRVDALLARLAARHGATYVSTSGLTLPYLPDGLHLTPEGHTAFGEHVAAVLTRL